MEIKTLEKLRRRLQGLESHHIDTSVIVEAEKTDDGKYCRKYFQLLGYKYMGTFSSITMSEVLLTLLKDKDSDARLSFLRIFDHLMDKRKVVVYTPKRIGALIEEISELDRRLEPHDIMIIACATEDGAVKLVTLDKKLLQHMSIEARYGLKIVHPKELV